ncbi:MAG: histidinol-phosphatase [Alistipes sp.]|nr:histidinol-phosphatase [Alistipes sp.]
MKRLLFLALLLVGSSAAYAQYDNPDIIHTEMSKTKAPHRLGIILPQVNGYTPYKADLHTHSIYSDAEVTAAYRVREAWSDGLDVMAVTEHIEYRRIEPCMLKFLKGYTDGEVKKPVNHAVNYKDADERGIPADLNYPVKEAQKEAKRYGLLIIPGAEITRAPETIGHYNALFTTDNNTIYTQDALQAIRNARAQGALVMHNHPGWKRKSVEMLEFEKKAYGEGLIDGVEIMNGGQFYPKLIDRCKGGKHFMSATTDIHTTTQEVYGHRGLHRNMTFIFAKEKSLESIREALEARRTIAYSAGQLAGEEQLLADFFKAAIEVKVVQADKKKKTQRVEIRNLSSIDFQIRQAGDIVQDVHGLESIILSVKAGSSVKFVVENMWIGDHLHPTVEVEIKK